ncbi:MAG: hypothetical protein OEZ13_00270 [Spirochaetia bacterium]|nr:hypothetical protein [Spirochaetia bacterium]
MSLTEEQKKEIIKLQNLAKQYEGIIRTSRNEVQLNRSKIDLKKIKDRIDELCPNGIPASLVERSSSHTEKVNINRTIEKYEILSRFTVEKISPHCEDDEINLLASIFNVWEIEFLPALGESHIKLDFSMSNERDSHYSGIESFKRQLKVLIETIEDYHSAVRDDVKLQLKDMKQRHTRAFLNEGALLIKKYRDFWKIINNDIRTGGNRCLNKNDIVEFNLRFEKPTFLQGLPIPQVINMTEKFLVEAIDALRLPEIPTAHENR